MKKSLLHETWEQRDVDELKPTVLQIFETMLSYGFDNQSIDPWALSIHQSIHNIRSGNGIQGIDDMDIPDALPHPIFLRQYKSLQPMLSISTNQQAADPTPQNTSFFQLGRGKGGPTTSNALICHPASRQRPARAPGTILHDQKSDQPLDQQEEPLEPRDYTFAFLSDTLPRQIYLHLLLRIPALYFSRVDHIFTDADLTFAEIKDMALCATAEDSTTLYNHMLDFGHDVQTEFAAGLLPPSYKRLTLNIVSGLFHA